MNEPSIYVDSFEFFGREESRRKLVPIVVQTISEEREGCWSDEWIREELGTAVCHMISRNVSCRVKNKPTHSSFKTYFGLLVV